MSSGELLLTLLVALIVFGPQKLPLLATHLGLLVRKCRQFSRYASHWWQQQLNELQLQENERKAAEADRDYQTQLKKPEES